MLIPKSKFIGLENIAHLCAGGETPMLKSHRVAIDRFITDKGSGEVSRDRFEECYARCKVKVGRLLGVPGENIAFLASTTDGINLVAHALDWQPGDNVVVGDVEFPSDVLPWTRLEAKGVELRVVHHRDWAITLKDIEAVIDDRTRVVDISHVSYFTGQRQSLHELSNVVRASNALLLVDATHAAGAVPVQAEYADVLVSSCYKWLLGTHGVGVFYWNRERLPDLQPPFLGWNSTAGSTTWQNPTQYELKADADRFVPGNPNFMGLYILENALDHLLEIGLSTIEEHVLHLSEQVWHGLTAAGWNVITPAEATQRAGNVCFIPPEGQPVAEKLAAQDIHVWGGDRVRVSTHLYNDDEDVARLLGAMNGL